jgi:hypothetical protein
VRRALLALTLLICACGGVPPRSAVMARVPVQVVAAARCASPVSSWAPSARAASARSLAAVLTHGATSELRVYELQNDKLLWRQAAHSRVRPILLDDVVVTIEDTAIVARDLNSGATKLRATLPEGEFLGATQVGRLVVSVVNTPTWDPATRHSTLAAWSLDTGALQYTRRLPELVGRPHAVGTQVWALSDRRDLRAFDAAHGGDLACTPLADAAVVEGLHVDAQGVWFGTREPRRLSAGADATSLAAPSVGAPAELDVLPSDYLAPPAARSAHGRVAWLTTANQPALFYFVFHRHLIAYEPNGSVRWASVLPRDIARAQATDSALWLLLEDGRWLALDAARGDTRRSGNLGIEIASVELALRPTEPEGSAQPAMGAVSTQTSLAMLAQDPDTRLLPSRRLAADALAKFEGDDATRALLTVARAASTPDALRAHVVARLTERTTGVEPLLQALDERYDFLQGTSAPPLRVLIPPLMALKEPRALPALERHLMDPATPTQDLALCVQAIAAIGGSDAHDTLARFAAMYRRDSALAHQDAALVLAERAVTPAVASVGAGLVPAQEGHPQGAPLRKHERTGRGNAVTPAVDAVEAGLVPALRPRAPRPTPAAFWALAEARAPTPHFIPKGEPWWSSQNDLFISIEAAAPQATHSAASADPSEPAQTPPTDAWWTPVSP